MANHSHIALQEEFDENIGHKFGADCTLEDFPDVALEDTPCYYKFNNVNIDLRHQDREWLERWRNFTGEEPNNMDNEDPWVMTGIEPEVPTPEVNNQYLGVSILLPQGSVSA